MFTTIAPHADLTSARTSALATLTSDPRMVKVSAMVSLSGNLVELSFNTYGEIVGYVSDHGHIDLTYPISINRQQDQSVHVVRRSVCVTCDDDVMWLKGITLDMSVRP